MGWKRSLLFACVLALALGSAGCGALTQLVFGWSSEETVRSQKTHQVRVASAPPGAEITRRAEGTDRVIGPAPLWDNVEYEEEEVVEEDGWVPMLTVGIIELLVGTVIAVVANPTDEVGFDTTADDEVDGLSAFAGFLLIAGLVDTIWGGVRAANARTVVSKKVVGPTDVTYVGQLAGLPSATTVTRVPDSAVANLILDPSYVAKDAPPSAPPAVPLPPSPAIPPPRPVVAPSVGAGEETKSWIIAVMEVEDVNAKSRKKRVDRSLVRNLGDQLRIFVAQSGVRTIDRSAQDRALADKLKAIKAESYEQCYDDSCQIELGKALAASHILRSRITKFGKRCVLNGELIDLRAEVTVKAASSQGSCEAEGFLVMCERVAQDLVR